MGSIIESANGRFHKDFAPGKRAGGKPYPYMYELLDAEDVNAWIVLASALLIQVQKPMHIVCRRIRERHVSELDPQIDHPSEHPGRTGDDVSIGQRYISDRVSPIPACGRRG